MLPIWEGTTNVLALDALIRSDLHAGLAALLGARRLACATCRNRGSRRRRKQAVGALERAALSLESGQDMQRCRPVRGGSR